MRHAARLRAYCRRGDYGNSVSHSVYSEYPFSHPPVHGQRRATISGQLGRVAFPAGVRSHRLLPDSDSPPQDIPSVKFRSLASPYSEWRQDLKELFWNEYLDKMTDGEPA